MSSTTRSRPELRERLNSLASPKNLISTLITVILVLGEWRYGVVGGYGKLALTLGTCVGVEIALGLFLVGKFPRLQSAYISGVSLALLVRPAGGLLWPFLAGAALAIGSKYVLRYRGRHLWNPSNLGIALLVLLAPSRVALLSHELGNDFAVNGVIWTLGLLIASRAKVLHVSAVYATSFAAFACLRAGLVDSPLLAELAPLTGPMYQLLVFFMLTDPRTAVGTRRGRMLTAFLVALAEFGLRLANDFEVPGFSVFAPAPAILALAVVGPLAFFLDLRARSRPPQPSPATEPCPPASPRIVSRSGAPNVA